MAKGKKTGGRVKGTPNKATVLGKTVIIDLLSEYNNSGQMTSDFAELEPKERLIIAERLMQYVLPKMQSTSVDVAMSEKRKTIEDSLAELAREDD